MGEGVAESGEFIYNRGTKATKARSPWGRDGSRAGKTREYYE
jgi:hypothetical protein